MAVFFNGRLLTSPVTASNVDDSGLANQNLATGNVVALLGKSIGGKPNTPLLFGSPSEAKDALIGGELLTAVQKAFAPSAQTNAPSVVMAIRVDPASQASLVLKDDSTADAINLTSTDYGLYTNQIKVKVESGSVTGKKLTTQFGNDFFTQDNVTRNAFLVRYNGVQVSAVMTISGTSITLQAPSGSTVGNIDLSVHNTMLKVVDRINAVVGFSAQVLDGNDEKVSFNGLDFVSNVDVRSADYTAKADLQASVDWFNSTGEGYITAVRANNAGLPPSNIAFTYLSGAVNGTVTNTNWSDGFTVLQSQDVQWITPITGDPAIHAMASAHCTFMSTSAQLFRRAIVGTGLGTSDADALAAAKALNNDRVSLVHIGFNDLDDLGNIALLPPYVLAALIAGAFAGVDPGTALTNKSLAIRGLERNVRRPTDTDQLINGGVLAVENTSGGFKVVQSISTWLVNNNFNRVEVSTGAAIDFTLRSLNAGLDILRGEKANQVTLNRAPSIVDSICRQLAVPEPRGPGVLAGDANNPAYKNISVSLSGDVIRVSLEISPVVPANFILISVFAKPFSGTVSI